MPVRTLTFPSHYSAGLLITYDPESRETTKASATADVHVPAGHRTVLLPDDEGCRRLDWVTGLPPDAFHGIQVPPDVTEFSDESAQALSRFSGVREFYVYAGSLGDAGLAAISALGDVSRLQLVAPAATDASPLRALRELNQLTLHLPAASSAALVGFSGLEKLEHLSLNLRHVGPTGLEWLAACPSLSQLFLTADELEASALDGLSELPSLRTLHLGGPVDDAALAALGPIATLTTLALGRVQVTPDGWAKLAPLGCLEALSVSEAPLGDAALQHIAELPALRQFATDAADITDAGLVHLGRARGLVRLALENASISGAGLRALGTLDELATLYLGPGCLGDGGATALAVLPALHELTVAGAAAADFVPLLRERPDVVVNGVRYSQEGIARLAARPGSGN